jgi:hypothetical protein
MSVDEALIVLAELFLLAALTYLASRVHTAATTSYPALVAKAINATPPYSEVTIALPKPIHLTPTHVSYAGAKAPVRLASASGSAYSVIKVYNATTTSVAVGG